MRARDLMEPYPYVYAHEEALTAAHQLVDHRLPALLVLDSVGGPFALVPSCEFVRTFVPSYAVQHPGLSQCLHEEEITCGPEDLREMTVIEWLPDRTRPPMVGPDCSVVQAAALMARRRSALVAVVTREGRSTHLLGVITATRMTEYFTENT
ncbi:CBS domain-containing protein [Streptomyces sp. NPDC045456]|uniref:CBS domain-containing protein n=1 Tax=Streptomyces sp. NPDC045456 TaxID=3155254 RepID=UPI0033D69482